MKFKLLNHRLGDLLQQRNLLLGVGLGLFGLNLIQSLSALLRDERIVVVPPEVKQSFWVQRNAVSAAYLEEMALFYADLILEMSPASAAYKREVILRNTAPSHYGALRTKLLEDEKRLKKEALTTSFEPLGVKVNPKALTVEVTGDVLQFVGEKKIAQSRDTYAFGFVYRQGRLLINSFKKVRSEKDE